MRRAGECSRITRTDQADGRLGDGSLGVFVPSRLESNGIFPLTMFRLEDRRIGRSHAGFSMETAFSCRRSSGSCTGFCESLGTGSCPSRSPDVGSMQMDDGCRSRESASRHFISARTKGMLLPRNWKGACSRERVLGTGVCSPPVVRQAEPQEEGPAVLAADARPCSSSGLLFFHTPANDMAEPESSGKCE